MSFMAKSFTAAVAGFGMVVCAGAANAVTSFDVNPNGGSNPLLTGETGIADGASYTQSLTVGDSVSVETISTGGVTSGTLGFTLAPSPQKATVEVAYGSSDFSQFGNLTVSLTDGSGTTFAPTISSSGIYTFFGISVTSPFSITYSWTNSVAQAFGSDVYISAIPIPAGIVLLMSGLLGLGALGRMRKA